jgi:two-component system OmpR family response regulator
VRAIPPLSFDLPDSSSVPSSQEPPSSSGTPVRPPEAATVPRVLLIEDDDDLRDTVCRYLSGVGIVAHELASAEGLEEQLARHPVDVVICDVNLPSENGFSIVARLRMTTKVGVIMATARGLEEDRLLGLSLGADCYLTKPVNLRELEFVIRNLHRRLADETPPEPVSQERWQLDTTQWLLIAPNGRSAKLTMAEVRLTGCLIGRAGDVVTREELLAALGRPNLEAYSRNLDVTVSRLRRRVEDATGMKLPLNAARGSGYIFSGYGDVGG